MTRSFRVILLALVALGCGSGHHADGNGDDDATPEPEYGLTPETIASYEGVYALETFTENASGCDVEGPSVLATKTDQRFLLVGPPQAHSLVLASCEDDAECAAERAEIREASAYSAEYVLLLSTEWSRDALADAAATPGSFAGGVCTGRKWTLSQLTRSGETVHVETRILLLPDAAIDAEECTQRPSPKWEEEAVGRPCISLRMFSGTKSGPLPS